MMGVPPMCVDCCCPDGGQACVMGFGGMKWTACESRGCQLDRHQPKINASTTPVGDRAHDDAHYTGRGGPTWWPLAPVSQVNPLDALRRSFDVQSMVTLGFGFRCDCLWIDLGVQNSIRARDGVLIVRRANMGPIDNDEGLTNKRRGGDLSRFVGSTSFERTRGRVDGATVADAPTTEGNLALEPALAICAKEREPRAPV